MKYLFFMALLSLVFIQGCYYDNKELLDPNSGCDTTFVTYSASVNAVLTAYCIGCHSGANAPLGIALDTYAGVKTQALSGKLFGTINHSSGYLPMPQNGNKLSDCNIAKIRLWVAAGAPNN